MVKRYDKVERASHPVAMVNYVANFGFVAMHPVFDRQRKLQLSAKPFFWRSAPESCKRNSSAPASQPPTGPLYG